MRSFELVRRKSLEQAHVPKSRARIFNAKSESCPHSALDRALPLSRQSNSSRDRKAASGLARKGRHLSRRSLVRFQYQD
jgi:hypothetical protein